MAEIFTESYYQSSSIFLKFGEIEYFAYKRVFGFPRFALLPFYEAFSIPVKNKKSSKGHKSNFHEQ